MKLMGRLPNRLVPRSLGLNGLISLLYAKFMSFREDDTDDSLEATTTKVVFSVEKS